MEKILPKRPAMGSTDNTSGSIETVGSKKGKSSSFATVNKLRQGEFYK